MKLEIFESDGRRVAVVPPDEWVLTDTASALDMILSARYDAGANRVAIAKEAVGERFFSLRTGVAGEILQKFVTYRVKVALYGDFSHIASAPLRDFIAESNRGRNVFFAPTKEEAVRMLAEAPD